MAEENVTLRDYTEAFKVKKALRQVGKANIPLKEGLFVDDIKVFGITLVLWMLFYSMVLSPPIKVVTGMLGLGPPTGIPYFLILLTPPLTAAVLSRRPVRHNLAVFGLIRAMWRDLMDDPVHRKGVPVKKGHGVPSYRIVLWHARPDLLPDLAPRIPLPNGYPADLAPVRRPRSVERTGRAVEQVPAEQAVEAMPPIEDALAGEFLISTRRPAQ